MDGPRFDLSQILAIAREVIRADASAEAIAASVGSATDLFGRGDDWGVDSPNIPGVQNVVVIGSPNGGPAGSPNVVLFGFAKGKGPGLREIRAVLGKGAVVEPLDWEPWRLVFDGPSSASASVRIVVSTNALTGDEPDPLVTEIALRRDPRHR